MQIWKRKTKSNYGEASETILENEIEVLPFFSITDCIIAYKHTPMTDSVKSS